MHSLPVFLGDYPTCPRSGVVIYKKLLERAPVRNLCRACPPVECAPPLPPLLLMSDANWSAPLMSIITCKISEDFPAVIWSCLVIFINWRNEEQGYSAGWVYSQIISSFFSSWGWHSTSPFYLEQLHLSVRANGTATLSSCFCVVLFSGSVSAEPPVLVLFLPLLVELPSEAAQRRRQKSPAPPNLSRSVFSFRFTWYFSQFYNVVAVLIWRITEDYCCWLTCSGEIGSVYFWGIHPRLI